MKKLKYGLIILFWILVLGILFSGYYHKRINNLGFIDDVEIGKSTKQ